VLAQILLMKRSGSAEAGAGVAGAEAP
jgi:hypothetical protein